MRVIGKVSNNKSVLIVATTAYMIRQFNMNNIDLLQRMGHTVDVACNFTIGNPMSTEVLQAFKDNLKQRNVICYDLSFVKSIFDLKNNLNAYMELKSKLKSKKYAFIHCQTPVAGVISRFAAWRTRTPNLYMAHGFHFYKGANLVNWLIYYPIEKLMSLITDVIIVINKEDYDLSKRKLYPKKLFYLPGVGIETKIYNKKQTIDLKTFKAHMGIPDNASLLLSVGELSERKNHEVLIKALTDIPDVHLMIAGIGSLESRLKQIAINNGVNERVHFLGFRRDIRDIYPLADIYCHPAFQEGLSVAIMEAMASSLPVVCANIRGNIDLIINEKGGLLVLQNSPKSYAKAINKLLGDSTLRLQMSEFNSERIKQYDSSIIIREMEQIYLTFQK